MELIGQGGQNSQFSGQGAGEGPTQLSDGQPMHVSELPGPGKTLEKVRENNPWCSYRTKNSPFPITFSPSLHYPTLVARIAESGYYVFIFY